ncbi:MAG TPA: Asp-tRNA(Asn)/Glu-tRNA(Gln) amidotransferase GatCAB subunit B, partial [Polyangiaceae bacterium]|nr:Asp-tRNA(Asn)/Glu-tRNA(Gln) amidotransferase GatCAB subunit B [Polyangiaceae bacterium]
IQTEVLRGASVHGLDARFTVTPLQIAELLELVESKEISGKQAKDVYALLERSDKSPRAIVQERGMRVVSDSNELQPLVERLIEQHPQQAAAIRGGKKGVLGFFVGLVMKETKGQAEPKLVSALFEKLLAPPS